MKSSSGTEAAIPSSQRIATIDILRAMTMDLLIFVNDSWALLTGIPEWLGHVERGVDGIVLADERKKVK